MKKYLIAILMSVLFCFADSSLGYAQVNNNTILYPVEATATKYGQTIKMPDLSGLPIFSATYDRNTNKVIVRRGDRKLTLNQANNRYYQSGQYGSLKYSIEAIVFNGTVSKIMYSETEDNITVKIVYTVK